MNDDQTRETYERMHGRPHQPAWSKADEWKAAYRREVEGRQAITDELLLVKAHNERLQGEVNKLEIANAVNRGALKAVREILQREWRFDYEALDAISEVLG